MKKIISAFLAAAVISASACLPVFADDNEVLQEATFCFDNDSSLDQWETYGLVDRTGFTMSISDSNREDGKGSLCISENVEEEIKSSDRYGGAFVTAESLGLEDFRGCTIQMSVMFDSQAAEAAENFTIFSDGIVWVSSKVSSETAGRWTKVSLTVPDNAANTKIGFTIPAYSVYSGNVAYVDNIIVYKADGTAIANVGDNQIAKETIVPVSVGSRVVLIVVLVVIIGLAALLVPFIVKSLKKKFT